MSCHSTVIGGLHDGENVASNVTMKVGLPVLIGSVSLMEGTQQTGKV
jgi:hypothetical protein